MMRRRRRRAKVETSGAATPLDRRETKGRYRRKPDRAKKMKTVVPAQKANGPHHFVFQSMAEAWETTTPRAATPRRPSSAGNRRWPGGGASDGDQAPGTRVSPAISLRLRYTRAGAVEETTQRLAHAIRAGPLERSQVLLGGFHVAPDLGTLGRQAGPGGLELRIQEAGGKAADEIAHARHLVDVDLDQGLGPER